MTTEDLSIRSSVPPGTINKILNGETKNPTAKTLAKLATALGSSVEFLYGAPEKISAVEQPEAKEEWHRPLLRAYQSAEKPIREATCVVLRIPYIEPEPEPDVEMDEMIVYSYASAAGDPLYAEDDYERIPFPTDEVPRDADFGIRIKGNSMEPTIEDGAIVWVRKTHELFNGQIGIFMIDDEAACKRFYRNGRLLQLESDNDAYDPIVIKEYQDFRIVGRVLQYK